MTSEIHFAFNNLSWRFLHSHACGTASLFNALGVAMIQMLHCLFSQPSTVPRLSLSSTSLQRITLYICHFLYVWYLWYVCGFYRILRGRIVELKNMCMFDGFFFFQFVFIFGCCWVFVAVHGFSLVVVSRRYCMLGCVGSVQWLLLFLGCTSFSRCGTQAWVFRGA